jgi:pimeloyl-ACP methyl ester carboxylesterase
MLQVIRRLLLWLQGGTWNLLLLAGCILIIWGFLAPVGTLVWWIKEGSDILGLKRNQFKQLPGGNLSSKYPTSNINCYIVFLPGVGDFSADEITPGEELFLNQLVKKNQNCVAVDDVFPYSAANKSLGGQRLFAPVWRFFNDSDGWFKFGDIFIKIRNLWRFAISIDDRYGSVYNQGIANAIIERMQAQNPIETSPTQPVNIILIGTSGGAEVALGAAPYLNEWLNANISVISVGGVFDGTNGFSASNQIYHLQGTRDWIEDIGQVVFPSRWRLIIGSPFNQARREGRYHSLTIGPHQHDGPEGYFGEEIAPEKQKTYVDITLDGVHELPIWNEKKPTNP